METISKFKNIIVLVAVLLSVFLAAKSWETINDISKLDFQSPAISVTGEGKVFAKPDLGVITLAINSEAKGVEEAQAGATQASNRIFEALKSKGVEEKDIKTTNYSTSPQYDYPDGKRRLLGYQVSQSFEVKIRELAQTGAIIQAASGAGANQVGGLSFTTEDPTKLQSEVRDKAIEDAKTKAGELAKKLGIKLGKIIGFNEFGGVSPLPYYGVAERGGLGGDFVPPQVPVGENEIRVNVNITYQIK
ncbi:MAG: SIMPL domain-containing protein [bacterium]|nr:SIMPL domain-containing protein [bacterium]